EAKAIPMEVASANWHATAALVAGLKGNALFVDMGSTTTDIIAVRDSRVEARGLTDAERLHNSELVYTGFVRTFPIAIGSEAPVRGRFVPLMNEYFASMSDIFRVLGALREEDDQHRTADNGEKTRPASIARIARLVGYDEADLPEQEWLEVTGWFEERQLPTIQDAAFLVSSGLHLEASPVGARIGRWQIQRPVQRLGRNY